MLTFNGWRSRRGRSSLSLAAELDCWAYASYVPHSSFTAIHETAGEIGDYVTMRTAMIEAVGLAEPSARFDVDISWLDWPEFGVEDFLSGIVFR